jgi:phospholipase/carboxylesterase
MSSLQFIERPPAAAPRGLLVLHHGRGSDERDLIGLGEILDPARELHLVTPRAPLALPGAPGFHWYLVPRVGFPDPQTFEAARAALAEFHDELFSRTGIGPERTVLGGFSMGCAMSHALALSAERPAPAGILGFSGFIPRVPGWEPALEDRPGLRAFIAHGSRDPVIAVELGRLAAQTLSDAGMAVEYRESDVGHQIDPAVLPAAAEWLARTLPQPAGGLAPPGRSA